MIPQFIEDKFINAREKNNGNNQNMYCPFCNGLIWSAVPYKPFHFETCPHFIANHFIK